MSPDRVNPFGTPSASPRPASDTPAYGIAQSGPPVSPAEVESDRRAVEVVVMWGDEEVLHVAHVSPLRDVFVGEGADTDYAIGGEILGAPRLPVVLEREGTLYCVLPAGAAGEVQIGGATKSFDELTLLDAAELDGARLYALPDGATAWIRHRALTFLVRPTNAGRTIATGGAPDWRRYSWVGVSLAVHAALLLMFYFMPPSSSALSLDQLRADDPLMAYVDPAAATVEEDLPEFMQPSDDAAGGQGQRHDGEEGQAGDETAEVSNNHYAIERRSSADPALARDQIRNEMNEIGAIGALRSLVGTWNVPTSPYGADQPNGNDAMDAIGLLMGAQAGPAFGQQGLGMHGTGRGAGGFGLGTMGLGRLGTIGRGDGGGDGDGYGTGVGSLNGRRPPAGPDVRLVGDAQVVGALSQEAIRRVVRRHLPEVRFCYEQGLAQNPNIEGRVSVNWIISPTGAVQSSRVTSSSLGNARVDECIANAVRRWSFPTPDGGGPVGVNYPFVLQSNL